MFNESAIISWVNRFSVSFSFSLLNLIKDTGEGKWKSRGRGIYLLSNLDENESVSRKPRPASFLS